ncbi:class F sortase [Geodermatophilus sp. DSM 45219]|uniref:class F sortase n=1 Tax=Geodermatophilus sp. DSM 45219 TaxID=1881103 RepID=UPI00088D9ACD|nr:class F sortase [Geodermatophilus sp. DSM 45219]SDO28969.1 Sortase family protein [Geodermatophilus sp. DSM 45219]
MSRHRKPRRPLLPLVSGLLTGAAVVVTAGTVALVSPGAAVPAAGMAPVATSAVPVVAEPGTRRSAAPPVRVRVPAIGVDSELLRLGTDAAGALVPPDDYDLAGWFAAGAVPGDVGPAVVAGHVDSVDGPAVFARLDELAPGDEVLVDREDGTTAVFTVTGLGRHPKSDFPTEAVYGPTPRAELRLVTCGGEFDRSARSYLDNVVVTAVLT